MNKLAAALGLAGICLHPTHALADWTGIYAGVSGGGLVNAEVQSNDDDLPDLEIDSSRLQGLFIGTQRQNGNLVFGGEFAFVTAPNAKVSDDDLDVDIYDVKARLGYAIGDALGYTAFGLSNVDAKRGSDDYEGLGANFGLGVDYRIGDNFVLGAEYLIRRARDGEDDSVDFDADSLSFRAAYKF